MSIITIITPTLNRPSLDRAVDSVMNQTNSDWRMVIVGDGCMPASYDDPRITSVYGPPFHNQSLTRNFALRRIPSARETNWDDWVGFLDDDDILEPEYIDQIYRNKDHADALIFRMLLPKNTRNDPDRLIPLETQINNKELKYGHIGISYAIKQEIFKVFQFTAYGVPYIENCANEDYNLIKELQNEGYRIKFLNYHGYTVKPQD